MDMVTGRSFAPFSQWLCTILLIASLAACVQPPQPPTPTPAATPLPAIALRPTGGTVKAAGKLAPVRVANLSLPSAGTVVSLTVQVGDVVQTGDRLLTLDSNVAEANLAQAQAAVTQAEANLALLFAKPRPAEIAAAQANLDAAKARLAHLQEGALPAAIDAAKAAVTAAQATRQQLSVGASEQARINAQTALSNTLVNLQQAQRAFETVAWRQDAATLPEGVQLQLAQNNYNAAQSLLDTLDAPPTADQIATADARLQQARAALATLQTPPSANQLAEAAAMVEGAQAGLNLLQAGPRPETVLAAQSTLSSTQAALQRTQSEAQTRHLDAPFAGTISTLAVNVGEAVLPAQVVITLADLSVLQVETTDLSERDVARLAVGQPATIYVEAIGGEIKGHVVRIAPQASTIGGDVVFPVTLALGEQPSTLRWGMSVQVEIEGVAVAPN